MFHKMPFILASIIISVLLIGDALPLHLKEIIYTLSLAIKEGIIFILPWVIISLLFNASISLSHQATFIIVTILIFVCSSNCLTTCLSRFVGMWVYSFDLSLVKPQSGKNMASLYGFNLPKLISNDKAMLIGLVGGIISTKINFDMASAVSKQLNKLINYSLKAIVMAIPVFVLGFVLKLQHDGIIHTIIQDYGFIFLWVALAQISYITLLYFVISTCRKERFLTILKNMMPAAISGFTTMSSAASLPLMLIGCEKNAHNKNIVQATIPATVNIHLIGDCLAIPIFAYAILKSFGLPEPSLYQYAIFTLYFIMAKFSVAAIPGGGIIVMLPILESQLGFEGNMLSLITALYILFDPVITCTNVLGNGIFARFIDYWVHKKSCKIIDTTRT